MIKAFSRGDRESGSPGFFLPFRAVLEYSIL